MDQSADSSLQSNDVVMDNTGESTDTGSEAMDVSLEQVVASAPVFPGGTAAAAHSPNDNTPTHYARAETRDDSIPADTRTKSPPKSEQSPSISVATDVRSTPVKRGEEDMSGGLKSARELPEATNDESSLPETADTGPRGQSDNESTELNDSMAMSVDTEAETTVNQKEENTVSEQITDRPFEETADGEAGPSEVTSKQDEDQPAQGSAAIADNDCEESKSDGARVEVNSVRARSISEDRWQWILKLKTVPKIQRCKVCGGRSAGLNYGVLTCRKCKVMFQRVVLHGMEASCDKENNETGSCTVDKTTRDRCRKCWFDKCLAAGMNAMDVRLRWGNVGRKLPLRCPRSVKDLTRAFRLIFVEYNRKVNIKYIRPILLSDRALEVGSATYKHIMFSEFSQHYEPLVSSLINFSLHIPGFEGLPIDDQMILLKTGFIDSWLILNARRLLAVRGCITLQDNTQIPTCELITMYSRAYAKSLRKVCHAVKKLRLTLAEKALAVAVALVCPDRPNLIEKERVRDLRRVLLRVKRAYSRMCRPYRKAAGRRGDRLGAVIAAVSQLGRQHADLMNFYRNQPDKLTVSPVIREVFDLHPANAYKEK